MNTTRRYLAFDIESAKITADTSDWRSQRPLGISCAAVLPADADEPILWHGGNDRTRPADRMTREEAAALVEYLEDQTDEATPSSPGTAWASISTCWPRNPTCSKPAVSSPPTTLT